MSLNIKTSQGLKKINTVHIAKPQIETKDVNFYDYDGTLIKSYSKNSFLKLNSLPANPTHEGLTAQGWNWNLNDAKDYVRDYGKLNIGQMYTTSDGKTRIYIHLEEGRLNPELNLTFIQAGSFTVDWGDGTTVDTVSGSVNTLGTIAHTYAIKGDYVIAITVISGKLSIVGLQDYSQLIKKHNPNNSEENLIYNNSITKVEIGNNLTRLNNYAFQECHSLTSITMPNSIEMMNRYIFQFCYALVAITIPNSISNLGSSAFNYCYSLRSVAMPKSISQTGGNIFAYCYSLTSITLSNSLTRLESELFSRCTSLSSIIIPNSITWIDDAFQDCLSLKSVILPTSNLNLSTSCFEGCQLLYSIVIPNDETNIPQNGFRDCCSLVSVKIPDSITQIHNNAFYACKSLASIIIPSNITTIGDSAFAYCRGLGYIKFKGETPPSIQATTFNYIPTDCIIYVPQGSLSAYTSAQYYPNPNTYTYIEY